MNATTLLATGGHCLERPSPHLVNPPRVQADTDPHHRLWVELVEPSGHLPLWANTLRVERVDLLTRQNTNEDSERNIESFRRIQQNCEKSTFRTLGNWTNTKKNLVKLFNSITK